MNERNIKTVVLFEAMSWESGDQEHHKKEFELVKSPRVIYHRNVTSVQVILKVQKVEKLLKYISIQKITNYEIQILIAGVSTFLREHRSYKCLWFCVKLIVAKVLEMTKGL